MIAAVVLAAGLARRMHGRQKLLLPLDGKPVVRWSVEAVLPHVAEVVVVTGPDGAVRPALEGLPDEDLNFLAKPYTLKQLVAQVEALASAAAAR